MMMTAEKKTPQNFVGKLTATAHAETATGKQAPILTGRKEETDKNRFRPETFKVLCTWLLFFLSRVSVTLQCGSVR